MTSEHTNKIRKVQRRLNHVELIRCALTVFVWFSIAILISLLVFWISLTAGLVTLIFSLLLILCLIRRRRLFKKLGPVEAALFLDQKLATKERLVSYQEVCKQGVGTSEAEQAKLIEDQLATLVPELNIDEVVPLALNGDLKKASLKLLVIWLVIMPLGAYYLKGRDTIAGNLAAEIEELLEREIALPPAVQKELRGLASALNEDVLDDMRVSEALEASQHEIDLARTQSRKNEDLQPESAEQDSNGGSGSAASKSSRDEEQSQNGDGTGGGGGEGGDGEGPGKNDAESGSGAGQGKGESKDSAGKGEEKNRSNNGSSEGKNSSQEGSAAGLKQDNHEKQGEQDGRSNDQQESDGIGQDGKSQNQDSGNKKDQVGSALEKAQESLDGIKKELEKLEKTGPSEKGQENQKNPDSHGDQPSNSQNDTAKMPESSKDNSGDQSGKNPEGPGQASDDREHKSEKLNSKDNNSESSLANPDDSSQEAREMQDEAGETDGASDRNRPITSKVEIGGDQVPPDKKHSGSSAGIVEHPGGIAPVTELKEATLARPDKIKDPKLQPIPLEYRDMLKQSD